MVYRYYLSIKLFSLKLSTTIEVYTKDWSRTDMRLWFIRDLTLVNSFCEVSTENLNEIFGINSTAQNGGLRAPNIRVFSVHLLKHEKFVSHLGISN